MWDPSVKAAQIGALVFVADFPGRWGSFFADVFAGEDILSRPSTVDFYLRVLIAIDSEVKPCTWQSIEMDSELSSQPVVRFKDCQPPSLAK